MPEISPDQYIAYDRWCRQHGGLTLRQTVQVEMLKEADDRCKRCLRLPDEDMRCEGMRLIFQPEMSVDPNRLVLEKCRKKDLVDKTTRYNTMLEAAGLKARMRKVEEANFEAVNAKVRKEGTDLYFDDVKLNKFIYERANTDLVHCAWSYLVAMAKHNLRGQYFLTIDYYRVHVVENPYSMLQNTLSGLIDCDWLIIDSLDYSNGMTMVRDNLFMTVKTRLSYNRPTMLLVNSDQPQWQSIEEKEFFEEARLTWDKFNLT